MKYSKAVRYWLILGCVLLFFQIMIGGITRITGSGLSITKWEIVMGSIPPVSEVQWQKEFSLYKETPQYKKINDGMSLSEFKFIYFWEYFHRLWARIMGFAFLFPLIYFLLKKQLDKPILKHLALMFVFAALAAIFGWIMVASGLTDRPWVNAYKLALHLSIALTTLGFLLLATYRSFNLEKPLFILDKKFRKRAKIFFVLVCIQIVLGAVFSGTRSVLVYPTWPQIGTEIVPQVLFDLSEWNIDNFINYDKNVFMPVVIHFFHRSLGYLVFTIGLVWCTKLIKAAKDKLLVRSSFALVIVLCSQVLLGILTLVLSKGNVHLLFGVLHQSVAVILFGLSIFILYRLNQFERV